MIFQVKFPNAELEEAFSLAYPADLLQDGWFACSFISNHFYQSMSLSIYSSYYPMDLNISSYVFIVFLIEKVVLGGVEYSC
jgi:hypothetical protein